MRIEIKTVKDLENTLGRPLARAFLSLAKQEQTFMNKPRAVEFHATKPEFYLGDGDVLDAYAVNLLTGEIKGSKYCGSGDTSMMHPEQLAKGYKAPENTALVFRRAYYNGRNMSWILTVVSPNIQRVLD